MLGFIEQLFLEGRVRVVTAAPPSTAEAAQAVARILEFEREYRRSLAHAPPDPSRGAVGWAAEVFYRAAQFLVFRDLAAEPLQRELSQPCPEPASPAVCYGVDLTFRFLPDLSPVRAPSFHFPVHGGIDETGCCPNSGRGR